MRPTILTFNLSESRLSKLRFLCMKLGLAVKAVPAEDFSQPIAALCGLAERADAAFLRTWTSDGALFASGTAAGVGFFACDSLDAECGEALYAPLN